MAESSPSDKPSEGDSKIFETISLKGSNRKLVRIAEEDMIWYDRSELFTSAMLGGSLGFAGSFPVWLGLALKYPIFASYVYTLLIFEIVGTIALSLLGVFRNRLLRKITNRGLVFTTKLQIALSTTYEIAIILALYGIFSVESIIPIYSLPLSIVLLGLYFLLIAPRFVLSGFLKEMNDARLSIFQFMEDKQAGDPRYFWLRRGMRGVERQLRNSGLSISPGVLFHGSSYSLFKDELPDNQLQSLAEWLTHPAQFQRVNSIIPVLMWQSNEAKEEGFGKAGFWDRLLGLPWQRVYRGTAGIGKIATAIAAIVGLILTILKFIHP